MSQAYSAVRYLIQFFLPISLFVYCYGRIFYVIRRQSKVVSGHAGRGQGVTTATTSRGQNTGQVQQQEQATTTGATSDIKLSRVEMNVIKTMTAVVIVHTLCWAVPTTANFLTLLGVSIHPNDELSVILRPPRRLCFCLCVSVGETFLAELHM